ncbi:DUF5753 domain-containing protein [Thermomonospora umbrina]|uniref:DUF5753 domain-containing protein n=1 Tax=Thermomonospora umbrina TaxID=111806 RepID=A0A3D9SXI3_9ACTN|nr:DUF5753 domain-containing protein [Thermomonospora umbrina]REF00667.1 hypothetical protein DFJ69_6224 [Thermomonospora umbrina]
MSMLVLLGRRLTELRTAAALALDDAARRVDVPAEWLANVEAGKAHAGLVPLVMELADLYQVVEWADRMMLVHLARQSKATNWWRSFGDVVDADCAAYLEVEQLASTICVYEAYCVPDLLQTQAYARALLTNLNRGADLDRCVEVCIARQRTVSDGQTVRAVIDEAALQRSVGGVEVMRDQLEHLVGLSDDPDMSIQVSPLALTGHVPPGVRTTLLCMPGALPDMVYLKDSVGGHFPEDVAPHQAAFDRASRAALPPDESRDFLICLAKEL